MTYYVPSGALNSNRPVNAGVLLQLTPPSQLREESSSVTAAFMRACDNGYLRLGIFNLFIDCAVEGRLELDLEVVYHQLVDHYLYRKPYDLARRPCFRVAALNDDTCRITPLGCFIIVLYRVAQNGTVFWATLYTLQITGRHNTSTILRARSLYLKREFPCPIIP